MSRPATPTAYITQHARDIARIYYGLFFIAGSWDEGVTRSPGVGGTPPTDPQWSATARENLCAPRAAGATESLLGVQFDENRAWPSGETLFSADFARTMARHFAAISRTIRDYDAGRIDSARLCEVFGTPPDWLMLGMLGNPNTRPQVAGASAANGPRAPGEMHHGRDGVVRWFPYANLDPLGAVRIKFAFDDRNTDDCSAQVACDVIAARPTRAVLWFNWDDGAIVRLNGRVVMDHAAYPKKGHGLLFRDRYLFEDHVPFTLPAGRSRLSVTSINSHGSWGVNLRIADRDCFPIAGLRFALPGKAPR